MEHFKESLGEGWETNLDKIEIYQKKKKIKWNLTVVHNWKKI